MTLPPSPHMARALDLARAAAAAGEVPVGAVLASDRGVVLAEAGIEPGFIMARIDPAEVTKARGKIPSLQHGRRFTVADPNAGPEHLHLVRGTS